MNDEQNIETQEGAVTDDANLDVEESGSVDNQEDENQNQEEGEQEDAAPKGDETPFPKKAVNAINRRDRQIRQLRAQLREVEAKKSAPQQENQQTESEPKEDDFDNYGDFLKARQDYFLNQHKRSSEAEREQSNLTQQQQQIREQQDAIINQQVTEMVQSNPDVQKVLAQNIDVIENMPPEIENLMYELDDPVSAGFALAKEGRLGDLYNMNPQLALLELYHAQQRGQQYLKQKSAPPVSKAPKPIAGAKGTGGSSKSLSQMTPEQIVDWASK